MEEIRFKLEDLETTKRLAQILSEELSKRARIYLSGELGSGKTTFVQFYLKALGYDKKVISPTFNLVKYYEFNQLHVYHIDAYRLKDTTNVFDFEDALYSDDVITLIEWPEMIERFLDQDALFITFFLENGIHYVSLKSESEKYRPAIKRIKKEFINV